MTSSMSHHPQPPQSPLYNYVADENDIIMVIYTAASLVHKSCFFCCSRVDIEHNGQQRQELWGDVDCKLGNREKEAIKLSQQAQQ